MSESGARVVDEPYAGRFVVRDGDDVAQVVYHFDDDLLMLIHTEMLEARRPRNRQASYASMMSSRVRPTRLHDITSSLNGRPPINSACGRGCRHRSTRNIDRVGQHNERAFKLARSGTVVDAA